LILCEITNHVAFITLNRPAALNALSLEMLLELRAQLKRCATDSGVRAIFLQGAGDKSFCAGGDIRAIYQSVREARAVDSGAVSAGAAPAGAAQIGTVRAGAAQSGAVHREFFICEYQLDYLLYSYPKPYVVLMDGITMGGGMGLAQGSALRIVGERTRIAMPEVGIGLFPDVGASYFLSRLPGSLGAYLALTGIQIRGADALYAQLADVYLSLSGIAALRENLASLLWSQDWKTDVRGAVHAHAATGLPAPSLAVLRPAIDLHFSQASIGAILESLDAETRSEYAEWARVTAALMRGRSPTMLRVTQRQLAIGRSLTLADCFRMELGMVQQCFVQGDFVEGVRALIIDKDNTPRWSPSRLEEVSDQSVDAFFEDHWSRSAHPLANLERATL
jgi:enoyl-CoA hydratase/carnithine racemase